MDQKTVITLDMGLSKSAKQLEYAPECCQGNWILRPGERHTVIAQLRTIGSYTKNSGLDDVWTKGDIYGLATVKQILEGKNMKRGLGAHATTRKLFSAYMQKNSSFSISSVQFIYLFHMHTKENIHLIISKIKLQYQWLQTFK